ncbi:MAG: hypothetical protein ACLS7W_03200 [Bifidobacterium longum]|uniref:hypothetical protein n=1 Tax=Bifidobacterium longum TaxID=216816 RepID=UPI0030EDF595
MRVVELLTENLRLNGSPNLPSQWLDEIFAIEVAGDGVVLDDELRVDGKRVMWVFSAADSP